MKKLMIVAAIVCAAAMSQAASIGWNMNGKGLVDANGNIGGIRDGWELALVVMGSATDWEHAVAIPTAEGQTAELGKTVIGINASNGRVTGTVSWTWTNGGENLIDNGDYLALMAKNKVTGELEQLVYTDGADKGDPVAVAYSVGQGIEGDNYAKTSQKIMATGNFSTAAVPEPTSAMLLLLGVAGLALRRKQK